MRDCIAGVGLCFVASAALAADVNVVGLFPGKAVVSIDGGAPRTLSVGQKTAEGITLISSDRESATFDVGNRTIVMRMGQLYASRGSGPATTTLTADDRGHFVVDGQINGGSVRFMVDTGATTVALSASDASRLGIDYRKGETSYLRTANGVTSAYKVKLDTVRVGDITLNNIDAVVLEVELPVALLGMSFLNRMEMKRDGQIMVLTKKF
jgi:aspartyl protease family protein